MVPGLLTKEEIEGSKSFPITAEELSKERSRTSSQGGLRATRGQTRKKRKVSGGGWDQ